MIAESTIKVYSKATANLLRPLVLKPTDRLVMTLSKDKKKFHVKVVAATTFRFPNEAWWDNQSLPDAHIEMRPELYRVDNVVSASALNEFPDRIPEKKRLDHGEWQWEMAATDYTAMVIKALWPVNQISMDLEAKIAYVSLLSLVRTQEEVAEVYAAFKDSGAVPEHGYDLHPDHPLSPYQQVAAYLADKSEGFGLFMDPGTGKTAPTIALICNQAAKKYKETGKPYKAIVVVPKNVQSNWAREFGKFTTSCGNVTILKGGMLKRMNLLTEAGESLSDPDVQYCVIITSYETMVRTWPVIQAWLKLTAMASGNEDFDLAAADEGHMFKWHKTTRYEFICKLRDCSKKRMVLTGTPVANSPLDLYCLFEFMGEHWSGFTSWEAWREFYGVFIKEEEDGYDKLVACQNLPFMQERLARLSFRITKKEALPNLPDKLYDTLDVSMAPKQADVYRMIAQQLAAEIEDDLTGDVKTLTIQNILTKLLRLSQITSGFVKWDPIYDPNTGDELEAGTIEYFDKNPKLDMLVEKLKARTPNQKTIVWSCWVPNIKQIVERLKEEGIEAVSYYGATKDRDEAERRFNCDPSCTVLVGNPTAGGVGLNLLGFDPADPDSYETNCDSVIYFAMNWSAITRGQSEDRANRRGTRVQTQITDLIVPGSIDEQIRDRVMQKIAMAMGVNDIRAILSCVLTGLTEIDE